MRTRRNRSLLRLGMAVGLASALAACTQGGQFDPTTLLDNDMFSSKTKLQGTREPVFPNGVPGATTGIPADLYKGYQPPPEQAADNGGAPTAIAPGGPGQAKPEATSEPKAKPKPKVARAPPKPRTEISIGLARRPKPAAQQQAQPAQAPWPSSSTAAQGQPPQPAWPTASPSGGVQQAARPSQPAWPSPSGAPSQ